MAKIFDDDVEVSGESGPDDQMDSENSDDARFIAPEGLELEHSRKNKPSSPHSDESGDENNDARDVYRSLDAQEEDEEMEYIEAQLRELEERNNRLKYDSGANSSEQKKKKKKKKKKRKRGEASSSSLHVASAVAGRERGVIMMQDSDEEDSKVQDDPGECGVPLLRTRRRGVEFHALAKPGEMTLKDLYNTLDHEENYYRADVQCARAHQPNMDQQLQRLGSAGSLPKEKSKFDIYHAGGYLATAVRIVDTASGSVRSAFDLYQDQADTWYASECRLADSHVLALLRANMTSKHLSALLMGDVPAFNKDMAALAKEVGPKLRPAFTLRDQMVLGIVLKDLDLAIMESESYIEDNAALLASIDNAYVSSVKKLLQSQDAGAHTVTNIKVYVERMAQMLVDANDNLGKMYKIMFIDLTEILKSITGSNLSPKDLDKAITAMDSASLQMCVDELFFNRKDAENGAEKVRTILNFVKILTHTAHLTFIELTRMKKNFQYTADLAARNAPEIQDASPDDVRDIEKSAKTIIDFKPTIGDVVLVTGGILRERTKTGLNGLTEYIQQVFVKRRLLVEGDIVFSTVGICVDDIGLTCGARTCAVQAEELDPLPDGFNGASEADKKTRHEHRQIRRELEAFKGVDYFDTNVEMEVGRLTDLLTNLTIEKTRMDRMIPTDDPLEFMKDDDDQVVDSKLLRQLFATAPPVLEALSRVRATKFRVPDRHRRAFLDGMLDITLDFDSNPFPTSVTPMVIPYTDHEWYASYLNYENAPRSLKYFHYPLAGHARNSEPRYLSAYSSDCYPIATHYRSLVMRQPADPLTHNMNFATDGMTMYRAENKVGPQMAKLFVGNSKTGKSTHVDLVVNTYPSKYEASIGGTEGIFGQQKFSEDMMLAHAQEMGPAMGASSTFMQSAIGRDKISVAVKHGPAREFIFQTFILMAGNMIGPWLDTAGSMLRRMLIFIYSMRFVQESQTINMDKLADIGPTIFFMVIMYLQFKHSRYRYMQTLRRIQARDAGAEDDAGDRGLDTSHFRRKRDKMHEEEQQLSSSYFKPPSTQYFSRSRVAYASHTSRLSELLEENQHQVLFVKGAEPLSTDSLLKFLNSKASAAPASGHVHGRQRAQTRFDESMVSNLGELYNLISVKATGKPTALRGISLCTDISDVYMVRFCAIALLGLIPQIQMWKDKLESGASGRPARDEDDMDEEDAKEKERRENLGEGHESGQFVPIMLPFESGRVPTFVRSTEMQYRYMSELLEITKRIIEANLKSKSDVTVSVNIRLWHVYRYRSLVRREHRELVDSALAAMEISEFDYEDFDPETTRPPYPASKAMLKKLAAFCDSPARQHRYPEFIRRRDFRQAHDRWMHPRPVMRGFELDEDRHLPRMSTEFPPPEDLQWTPINKHFYPSFAALVIDPGVV